MQSAANFLARWQWAGLFLVILAEEAGVPLPIPGDLFIAAMGFLSRGAPDAFVRTAAIVTAATVLGAGVLYTIARRAGRPLLLRVGRRFGYTEAREAGVEAWLARRGAAAVVVGRLVPGLRIVMTVVAGALGLPRGTFAAGTFFAAIAWATIYFWVGYALGTGYDQVAQGVPLKQAWPWLAAGACVIAFLGWRLLRGRRLAARARTEAAAGTPDAGAPPDSRAGAL